MESETDNLLEKLKDGDKSAFTRIFYIYNSRLSYFAKTYVIDKDIAANIVQDAFLQLWENKKKLSDNTFIVAYLYTITRNSCLNYLKHQRVEAKYHQKVIKDSLELELNYGALRSLDFDLYDFERVQAIIDKTIQLLTPQCKEVFMMSRFKNMSNAEIASKLNISVKAVEANITRALKIFRSELKDYLSLLFFLGIPFL